MDTGSVNRGTHFGKLVDSEGNEYTANPKQSAISPLKKDADLTQVINKTNEIIAALKMSNVVANKAE